MTESASAAAPPRPRRPLRRLAQVLGFGVALAIAAMAAVPWAASSGFFRERVAESLQDALGVPVTVDRIGFSWLGVVEVDGLGLATSVSEAAAAGLPRVTWRSAQVTLDPWALTDRQLDFVLRLEGVHVQVPERSSAETGRVPRDAVDESDLDGEEVVDRLASKLDRVRLGVEVRDARIEVVRDDGSIVEAIDVAQVIARKPFGSTNLELALDGTVRGSGAPLHFDVRADPMVTGDVDGALRCTQLDLGRLRPLIDPWFEPGSLDALEGVVEADLRVEGNLEGEIRTEGSVSVVAPRVAGALLSGLDFAVPALRLEPVCTITRTPDQGLTFDSSRVRLDAGVLTVEGRPADAGRFGFSFTADVSAIAAMGGPIPPALRVAGNRARGLVDLDLGGDGGSSVAWSGLDVDFVSVDQGVREELRGGRGLLRRDANGRIHVEASGRIRTDETRTGGTFALTAHVAPDPGGPATGTLRLDGWDFDDQRVLLDRLVPGEQFEVFEGKITADLTFERAVGGEIEVGGQVRMADAALAGPAVAGMELRGAEWTLEPNVAFVLDEDGGVSIQTAERLAADLGFLSVRGRTAPAGSIGLAFDCDGEALARMGAPLPAEVAGSGLRVVGEIDLPAAIDPTTLLGAMRAECVLSADRFVTAGQELDGLRVGAVVRDRAVALDVREGTWNGGPLRMTAAVPLDFEVPPVVRLSLGADGAAVGPSVLPALEYVLPTFAGLGTAFSSGLPVTFASQLGFGVDFEGPAYPAEGEPVLAWLDQWVGGGTVALVDGRFAPAAGLQGLLQLTGQSGVVAFDQISSRFELAQGSVRTGLSKLSTEGAEYGFRGETRLDGTLAHSFDARALLARHRDGRKILEYLGDTPVEAQLAGTLVSPRLGLPDVTELATRAAGSALEKEAKSLLDKVLGPDKGKGGEAAKGVGDLLRGILGGKKKGGG
ncbi:MAG: hypothetical protein ACO4CT_05245 [Planctomycetota bacterium]